MPDLRFHYGQTAHSLAGDRTFAEGLPHHAGNHQMAMSAPFGDLYCDAVVTPSVACAAIFCAVRQRS